MPCWSHFTSSPPAMAAVWAAVGFGFSTGSSPTLVEVPDDDDELDDDSPFLFDFSLLLILQAATTQTSRAKGIRFFIGLLSILFEVNTRAFYRNTGCQSTSATPKAAMCYSNTVPLSARSNKASSEDADKRCVMRQIKFLPELGTIVAVALLTFACVPPKNTNSNVNSNANANSNANTATTNNNANSSSTDSGS